MVRTTGRLALLTVVALLALAGAAHAAPGDPDPSFGTGGVALAPGSDRLSGQGAPLVQADGRIVVAGLVSSASDAIGLTRFTPAGALDQTFGSKGSVTTPIRAPLKRAASALAPDGRIVVAGGSLTGGTITVGRYSAAGAPDTTFNKTGTATVKLNATVPTFPTSALVQPDGSVLVTAFSNADRRFGLTVVKLKSTGALDTTFGAGKGYTSIAVAGKGAAAFDLARLSDGRLLVAGGVLDSLNANPTDTVVARLTTAGALDTTFGTGGTVVRDLSPGGAVDGAFGIAATATGGFFVTGPSGSQGMVAKFTSTGALDTAFGTGGMVVGGLPPAGARFVGADVTLDEAGRAVVAGTVLSFGGTLTATRWGVVRLNATGATPLDTRFGTGGRAVPALCANRLVNGPSGIVAIAGPALLVAGSCNDRGTAAVMKLTGGDPFQASLTLSATPATQAAGYERINLTDLDPSAILKAGQVLQAAPFRSSPFRSSPFRSSPFRSSPFRSSPFRSSPLALALPRTVLLSEIPLLEPRSWERVLSGTPLANAPLQTVTLADVLALDPQPNLSMADFDLDETPLRNVSLAAILLSPIKVANLPAPAGGWPDGTDTQTDTLLSLELAGRDLTAYYAQPLQLAAVPLGTGDQRAVLARIPLTDIDLEDTPLGAIPARLVANLLACATATACTGTLADRQAAAPSTFSTADLGALVDTLPLAGSVQDVSLGQLLLGLIGSEEVPFEQAPLRDLLDAAQLRGSGLQTFTAAFRLDCVQNAGAAIEIALPGDARFVAGSARLAVGSAAPQPVTPSSTAPLSFPLAAACGAAGTGTVRQGTLTLTAEPGSALGPDDATATLRSASAPVTASSSVVVDDSGDTDAGSPPALQPGVLRTGHLSDKDDVDAFTVAAPPAGSRLTITLAHLPADYDLVVSGPATDEQAAPFRSSPFRSSPFRSSPVPDASQEPVDPAVVGPNAVQDIPFRSSQPRGVSVKRGTADESVSILARETDQGGTFTVRVAGFDGATSPDPYVIRAAVTQAPPPPACAPRANLGTAAAGALPDVPDDARTLVLVNRQRMASLYGAGATDDMLGAFSAPGPNGGPSYLDRPEVRGVVVPVDADAGVRDAYAGWDAAANRCSVPAANAVVRAINDLVDGIRADHDGLPQLRSIVLVGADVVIPQQRVADESRLANESTFADDMTLGGSDTAVSRALREGNTLTDDAYGDFDPQSLGTRLLYIPDVALGRLVETPAEVTRTVEAYQANDGRVVEDSGFVAGYDFLKDGSQAVFDGLEPLFGAGAIDDQINDTWTSTTGLDGFNRPAPGISAVNAHFDTYRAMPANAFTNNTPDLFQASQATRINARTLLFTMGCHSGLNVTAAGITGAPATDPRYADWTQQVAGSGAMWVAQTGYGLGDSTAVAYSERLMGRFAGFVGAQTSTIGQALMFAKQDYAATSLGLLDDYDVKALQEATFYGLPTYRTSAGVQADPVVVRGTPGATAAARGADRQARAAARASLAGSLGDADTETFGFAAAGDDAFVRHNADRGSYWTVGDETPLVIQHRPIQPRATLDVTPADGQPVHGALVDELAMTEIGDVDPVIARPTIDLSAHEPEPPAVDAAFPASLAFVYGVAQPAGSRERLTLLTGQFRDRTQRLYTRMAGRTLRSTSTDWDPPRIRQVDAVVGADTVAFTVESPDADAIGGTVLFRLDSSPTVWRSAALARSSDGRLGASVALPPGTTRVAEWTVQLADTAGNVGVSTNKVFGYVATPAPAPQPGDPAVTLSAEPASFPDGTYDASPTITLQRNGHDGPFEYSVDGQAFKPYDGPFDLDAGDATAPDGVHIVRFRGSDGSTARTSFVIDREAPSISGGPDRSPNANGWWNGPVTVSFTCGDAGSGIAACTAPVTLSAETAGTDVDGTARDRVGRTAGTSVGPIRIDTTAPGEPAIDLDGGGAVTLSGDERLTGAASDGGSGIDVIRVRFVQDTGSDPDVVTREVGCVAGSGDTCRWSAERPPAGEWNATVTAVDRAGNTAQATARVTSEDAACADASGGLLVNGSFECPATVPPGAVRFFDAIPGWTVQPAIPEGRGTTIELQNNLVGPAFDGDQVLELDSFGPVSVSQTIDTQPGATYELRFTWSPRPGTPAEENHFRVSVNGETLAEVGPAATPGGLAYQTVTRAFGAGEGGPATITFTDLGPQSPDEGGLNDVGALLDAVRVTLVD